MDNDGLHNPSIKSLPFPGKGWHWKAGSPPRYSSHQNKTSKLPNLEKVTEDVVAPSNAAGNEYVETRAQSLPSSGAGRPRVSKGKGETPGIPRLRRFWFQPILEKS